jgi:signal transduction histidine kinase
MPVRDVKIRTAIAAALLVGLVVPGAISSWLTLRRQRELLTAQLSRYHARVTTVLALGMREPLWTMVPDLGRPLLESVIEDPRVVRVSVSGEGGLLLERAFPERRVGATWERVHVVVRDGEPIGEVEVEIDTGQMEQALLSHSRAFLLTTLVQLVLSLFIISLILRWRVVRPLRRLVRQSERLARRELDEPFVWSHRDELGLLGTSFEATRQSLRALFDTLHETNQELIRLNRGLEAAVAARSAFLANMSHELRTPLNSIIGFSGVLRRKLEGKVDDRQLGFVENIYNSGERLLRLIDDVLDLARIETGRMRLIPAKIDLVAEVEGIRGLIQSAAVPKNIQVELDLEDDLPQITTDPGKFKQILYHLMSNAVKFSSQGSDVRVQMRKVEADDPLFSCEGVRVDVVDHGIGIPAEDRETIFDEFRQLDPSPGRRYEGTGLGLALVKKLLEIQGGQIMVESEAGHGSTFTAFLPIEPPEQPVRAYAQPEKENGPGRARAVDSRTKREVGDQ